jgi:hypothetical protein
MSECRLISGCAFYNDKLTSMPGTAEFMKMVYCHQRSEECQRLHHSKQSPVDEKANITDPVGLNIITPVQ